MAQDYATIEVRPLSAALGAEIGGVDIARSPDDAQFAEIRRAYREFGVIFFRDQTLTPEQHIAFARDVGAKLTSTASSRRSTAIR